MSMLNTIFSEHFMQMSLAASMIIGITTSYIGVFVVLRRMIFVGIALAQFSCLGLAIAAYFHQDLMTFSIVFTALGVVVMAPRDFARRLPSDAIIGIGLAACWALSILFLSKADHGDAEMLTLMNGHILGTTSQDVTLLLFVLVPVVLLHLLFFKEFLFTSFDSEMAQALGLPSRRWNFLFYLTLGITIAVAIKLSGVLLTFSFLLFPAALSLLLSEKIRTNLLISVALSIIASFTGVVMSFVFDFPTAPTIVASLFVFFLLTFVFFTVRNLIRK
jgi:ABC-type Mn2+/Zn2+ transport system permease subunit